MFTKKEENTLQLKLNLNKIYPSGFKVSDLPSREYNGESSQKYGHIDKRVTKFGDIVHNLFEKHLTEDNRINNKETMFKHGFNWIIKAKLDLNYVKRLYSIIENFDEKTQLEEAFGGNIRVLGLEVPLTDFISTSLLSGRVDKLATNGKDLFIIDYKTTLKTKNINAFRGQGNSYRYLIEQSGDYKNYENVYFVINYLDLGLIHYQKLSDDYKLIPKIVRENY